MIAWKCANKALTADADNSKCAAWCTLAFRIVCLISQTPSSSLKEQNDGDGTVAGTESDDATRVNALVIVHKLAVCLIRCERLDEARRICLQGDLIDGSKSPTTAFLLACISLDQIKQTPPAVPRQRDDVLKKCKLFDAGRFCRLFFYTFCLISLLSPSHMKSMGTCG